MVVVSHLFSQIEANQTEQEELNNILKVDIVFLLHFSHSGNRPHWGRRTPRPFSGSCAYRRARTRSEDGAIRKVEKSKGG